VHIQPYQGRLRVTEQLQKTELAMAGWLGNDTISGITTVYHRLSTPSEALPTASAYNQRIRDAGLKTQNYDKALDGLVPKFGPEEKAKASTASITWHSYLGPYQE
jgi:hypothetical protein